MPFLKVLIAIPLLFLIACGGGGGSGAGGAASPSGKPSVTEQGPDNGMPPTNRPLSSYEMLLAETNAFLTINNLENGFAGRVALPKNIPKSGTARYTGTSSFAVGDCANGSGPHLAGKTNLTADFTKHTLTGSVNGFSAYGSHTANTGKLNINGKINGNKLTGKLLGNVGFDNKNFAIDGPLKGVFLNNADGVVLQSSGKTEAGDSFSATITASRTPASK